VPTSLFKFLTVLENDVWMCILGSYFLTRWHALSQAVLTHSSLKNLIISSNFSFLLWFFDRWSPYSYQNNKEKYEDDDEKREFTLKECFWFCMTSLTPQVSCYATRNLIEYRIDFILLLVCYRYVPPLLIGRWRISKNVVRAVCCRHLVGVRLHHHCVLHGQLGCFLDRLTFGHSD